MRRRSTTAAIALLAALSAVPVVTGIAAARADSTWGSEPATGTVTTTTTPAPPAPGTGDGPVTPDDSTWG